MCTMVMKETLSYYAANKGNVYCTLLDATKAFDRVNYCKLFRCLVNRKLPSVVVRLLVSMYTNHNARVVWNGVQSRWFGVLNGVKQGGVLSPILFCVYIDDLLKSLAEANVGCYIGSCFVGVLAYADDLVLLAPTATAMRRMLHICEEFANTFSVRFNASKSKCIVVEYRQTTNSVSFCRNVRFTIGGSDIEIVDSWPHLGHVISCNLSDKLDIERCHNKLVAQVNSVLCNFVSVDAIVKMKLLKNYCLSLYGCELWDLCHTGIERICKAWRMGVRRVWGLPYDCRTFILQIMSDTLSMYDVICKRSLMFIKRCLSGESDVVRFIAQYGILYGGMASCIGRNVLTYSRHYQLPASYLLNDHCTASKIDEICKSRVPVEFYNKVLCVLELEMIKKNIVYVPSMFFNRNDINVCISAVCCNRF